jgi:hypothetical protein
MTELQGLNGAILAINDESDAANVCEALDLIDVYKRAIREADRLLKEQLIDWINANGELTIGEKRYYVGNTKKTKPVNLERLCEAAITHAEGDFGAFAEALSANAFKPGACKALLGDEWGQHFIVEVVDDVKTGKPKKDIKVIDERFTKG